MHVGNALVRTEVDVGLGMEHVSTCEDSKGWGNCGVQVGNAPVRTEIDVGLGCEYRTCEA